MPTRGSRSSSQRAGNNHSATERYEVIKQHVEGVLFVVYQVRERSTLDVFALKALRQSYASHSGFQKAWQEAASASLHRHARNVARVYEVGVEDNTPYIVEEWLPGHTLEERLRRAPFGSIETLTLARHMADGLAALHEKGEVHGDFRPRQVLFTPGSELKITDIGWENAVRNGGLSLTDVFPDAAFYHAPELWNGRTPTAASDIYALGVALYRMLAGRVPFAGTSPLAIAERHQRTAPHRPSQFNPACAPELEKVVLGMLDKNPAHRQTYFDQLRSLHQEELTTNRPSTPAGAAPQRQAAPVEAPIEKKPTKPKPPLTRRELGKREFKGALLAFFWALVAMGLLAGIIVGAIYFWMQGAPPEVSVPNYVGMNQQDAKFILEKRGLGMEVGREVYNPKRPSGTVLSGQPRPETTVRSGRTILVTVSRGKEPIRMYDFRDLTLDQTKRIMQKHGLRLGQVVNQYDATIPQNAIITQYPEPGQYFHRYDPISLVVSRGPEPSSNNQEQTDEEATAPPPQIEENPQQPDDASQSDSLPADTSPDELISRDVQVNIEIPNSSAAQLVTIVVNDATGEHTVYSEIKQPGDTVDQTIHVAKTPSSSATVQVYAGGQLLREMRF